MEEEMTAMSWGVSASFLVGSGPVQSATGANVDPAKAQIHVLYDAFGQTSGTQKDWGYAAFVEYGGKRSLFDTGNNPDILAQNAKAKGIDISNLDFVVVSHRLGDHMGGLSYVLSVNRRYSSTRRRRVSASMARTFPAPSIAKDPSLPSEQHYYNGTPPEVMRFGSAWPSANFELVDKNTEIAPNIHLVTLVSDKPGTLELRELSLVINTSEGLVIVVGRSHLGIDKIVESATAINPRIHLIAGGFHLVVAPDPDIEKIVTAPLHRRTGVHDAKESFRRSIRLCGAGHSC